MADLPEREQVTSAQQLVPILRKSGYSPDIAVLNRITEATDPSLPNRCEFYTDRR